MTRTYSMNSSLIDVGAFSYLPCLMKNNLHKKEMKVKQFNLPKTKSESKNWREHEKLF